MQGFRTASADDMMRRDLVMIGHVPHVPEEVAIAFHPGDEERRAKVEAICDGRRAAVIKAIRDALRERSGRTWSVTGDRGTAYCWLNIGNPPARGDLTDEDRSQLAELLGLEGRVALRGVSIAPGWWQAYVARALYGDSLGFREDVDWD